MYTIFLLYVFSYIFSCIYYMYFLYMLFSYCSIYTCTYVHTTYTHTIRMCLHTSCPLCGITVVSFCVKVSKGPKLIHIYVSYLEGKW
jgi:hypothetical protein